MKNVSVSVIGCSSWGRNHVRVYKELKNVTLAAIVDEDKNVVRETGERYGAGWCTDPEEVFKRSDIDAVSICTPTRTHTELAMRAIQSKKMF